MAEDTMLAEAISAAKAGELARARDLLARLLRADSSNPDYWLWMSSVVESERESVYCLRSVTKMRPGHPVARLGLTALGQITLAAEHPGPIKQRRATPFPHQAAGSINSMADWWKIRRNRENTMIALLGSVLTVLVLLVIAGSLESGLPVVSSALAAGQPTVAKMTSPSASGILSPGAGQISTVVRTGTPSGLVPLPTYINIPQTPTPLYGLTPSTAAFDLGMKAFQSEKYQEALNQFQTADRFTSNNAQITFYIAETLRKLKRMPDALEKYNLAVQLDPHYAMAYFGRAMWHKQDNPGSAYINDLNQALYWDPKLIDAYIERAYYNAYLQGNWEDARADLEQAVALNPNQALGLIRLGRAQVQTGQRSEALINLMHAQMIDPTILEGYLGLGESFYALGLYSLGEEPLHTYTVYKPDDINGWILLCQMYAGSGNLDNAVAAGSKALEIDPSYTRARLARGDAYRLHEQYALATADFLVAYQRAPSWYDASFGYGRALVLSNDPNTAVGVLNETIQKVQNHQLNTDITPAQMADLIGWNAFAYDKKGEPDRALLLWNQLINLEGVPESWKVEAYRHILKIAGTPTAITSSTPAAK
jgi:tetratricopeptide (TPR) repeat protein